MAEEKLSEFQKKKIMRVFNTFYDSNADGIIERKDFDMAIKKICHVLGWPKDGTKHKRAQETLYKIWDGLKKYADENGDEIVTKDEWLKMWGECVQAVKSGKGFPEWQTEYMEFMFEVNDTSEDNEIDKNEYTTVYKSYGIPPEECSTAFDKISGGKNISRKDFEELWMEYFVSDDENARGNYLFGIPTFK